MKPCRKCGSAERGANGQCLACGREAMRRYRAAHPERVKDAIKKSRAKKPDKYRQMYQDKSRRWKALNPEKSREVNRNCRARKPLDKRRAADRRGNLKRFNLTPATYQARLDAQGGVCRICGQKPSCGNGRRLNVDHCHKTGALRGLLCLYCNSGIGYFKDDPEILRAAIRYLEEAAANGAA